MNIIWLELEVIEMKNKHFLKIGDKIRIVAIPGENVANYCIHSETKKTYKKLIDRKRPVRINRVDEYGQPWYDFRFQKKNGSWERHTMCVMKDDDNWVKVQKRKV